MIFVNTDGHIVERSSIDIDGNIHSYNTIWFNDHGGISLNLYGTQLDIDAHGKITISDHSIICITKLSQQIVFIAWHKEGHYIAGTDGDIEIMKAILEIAYMTKFFSQDYKDWFDKFLKFYNT